MRKVGQLIQQPQRTLTNMKRTVVLAEQMKAQKMMKAQSR